MSYDKSNLKKWVIDIDSLDQYVLENTKNILSTQCGVNILAEYPTKNGYHLITNGFDTRDVKRDGGCALIAFSDQL